MNTNQTNNGNSRKPAKKITPAMPVQVIQPANDNTQSAEIQIDFGVFFRRLLRGVRGVKSSLHQIAHKKTYGVISKTPIKNSVKLSILGIIIYVVFIKNLEFTLETSNFGANIPLSEKTHTDKPSRKPPTISNASVGAFINDLSPASPKELRENQVRSYIERFSSVAIAEMDKYGIPASISMAQAIIESRAGTSTLAVKNNNHFGIKCFSKSCPKGHCSNFTDDHHKDFFRKYTDTWSSWREHSQFLMKHRYRNLLKYGKDYRRWAAGLREFGYATDNQYDKKLIEVIEKYNLDALDDL